MTDSDKTLDFPKSRDGVRRAAAWFNQSPEPTPTTVTPPAEQEARQP